MLNAVIRTVSTVNPQVVSLVAEGDLDQLSRHALTSHGERGNLAG